MSYREQLANNIVKEIENAQNRSIEMFLQFLSLRDENQANIIRAEWEEFTSNPDNMPPTPAAVPKGRLRKVLPVAEVEKKRESKTAEMCAAKTKKGTQCTKKRVSGKTYCSTHAKAEDDAASTTTGSEETEAPKGLDYQVLAKKAAGSLDDLDGL